MNILVQLSFLCVCGHVHLFIVGKYIIRLLGKHMFNCIRNHQNIFQSGLLTSLQSLQRCLRIMAIPQPRQNWVLSVFLILAILGMCNQFSF